MSEQLRSHEYAAEIRSWLLGRLAKHRSGHELSRATMGVPPSPPLLSWWIFEGLRYRDVLGPLCRNFPLVRRAADALLASYSTAWRILDRPEAEIDWLTSALLSAVSGREQYRTRSSTVGLTGLEREALLGWLQWLRYRWQAYVDIVGPPDGAAAIAFDVLPSVRTAFDHAELRRWAHTAKRSRWPLLRNVVAESLRPLLEPAALDRIPLPSEHPRLFELLCAVRVLRCLDPFPSAVRWLDLEAGSNKLAVAGARYSYQMALPRELVLSTYEFDHGLRDAFARHHVRVPSWVDGYVEFSRPLRGFFGILLEAKSGQQGFDACAYQLKVYRAAIKEKQPNPLLIWGIVEQSETEVDLPADFWSASRTEDVWLFSTADQVPAVMSVLMGTDPSAPPMAATANEVQV